jgi:hypothetical protein
VKGWNRETLAEPSKFHGDSARDTVDVDWRFSFVVDLPRCQDSCSAATGQQTGLRLLIAARLSAASRAANRQPMYPHGCISAANKLMNIFHHGPHRSPSPFPASRWVRRRQGRPSSQVADDTLKSLLRYRLCRLWRRLEDPLKRQPRPVVIGPAVLHLVSFGFGISKNYLPWPTPKA